ncbi:ATP synthase subunit beta [Streptomyces glaucescens]
MTTTAQTATATGRVARVIGPVVDVEFPVDAMPEIYNALHVEVADPANAGEKKTLTLEVAQHLGDGLVRAISMQPTDGLVRQAPVVDTGDGITVPVGDFTKGKVFNTLGEVLNVDEAYEGERWSIHRKAPNFDELESKTEMFETGVKVIDLDPVRQGWQDRSVRRRRRRQDGAHPGDDLPRRQQPRRCLRVRRRR